MREPTPLGMERSAPARDGAASVVWLYRDFQVWLSEEATDALLGFARELDVTLNTLLLGAWSLLLSRASGGRNVLFGVVRTHRGALADGASILGPVMNSVPFRAGVDPAVDLAAWLRGLRAHWLALRAGDFASPAEIRGWSELDPRAPFFETLVLFETHELTERLRRLGTEWRNRSFRFVRQSRVPLSIYGYLERRLALKVIFDPSRFEAATMRRLLGHLQVALEAMPRAAGRPLAELQLLTRAERHQLLVEWNDTAGPADTRSVDRRFEEQARRVPEAVAAADPDGAVTYGVLDGGANRLARLLAKRGVGPGTIVGVLLERSVREVEALLAVLKAGGAYLPLEGSAPERVEAVLEDAGAELLLTLSTLRPPLRFPAARTICLDEAAAELLGEDSTPPERETLPEQPAYVIYTSGSTGRPKGVVVPHRGLANLVDWHLDAFGLSPADRTSRLAGLGFDAAVWELWPSWSAGAAVLMPPEAVRSDPRGLRDWLLAEAVTLAFAPTPMAERLLALPWPASPPLRLLLTGGDALHGRPAANLPFRLINNYGPTENSVVATSGPVAPATAPGVEDGRPPAIGRPIRNVRVQLLDPDLRPVPIGARGELCIAGAGLAQCYLGRPELTAESLVPDPHGAPGERMYLTGDLARFLPGGEIEFLGRRDAQLKVRGFRIEPGEIEAALGRHPVVAACAVVAWSGEGTDDKQLVAFVVTDPASAVSDAELAMHLRGKLPPYMVPALYVRLDALPVNSSGKVDRKALAERAARGDGGAHRHVPPVTPLERLVAEIWDETLGHAPVGLHDDFFALGGNSFHVMQLAAALREVFAREVSVDLVFLASTVARLIDELFPSAAERAAAEDVAAALLGEAAAGASAARPMPSTPAHGTGRARFQGERP